MSKIFLLAVVGMILGLASCAPVFIKKSISETYVDPKTGKTITYTEEIMQQPESRRPIHLKHQELYE